MQRTTWIRTCGSGLLALALSTAGACDSDSSASNDAGDTAGSGTGGSSGGAANGTGSSAGNGGQGDAGHHGGGADGGSTGAADAGGTGGLADAGGDATDAGGGAGGNNGPGDGCSATRPKACDFVVGVEKKDQTHPWNGMGFDFGYVVDGVQGATLNLKRRTKYTFLLNQGCAHPFYIGTSNIGGATAPGQITAGVSLSGAAACDDAVLTYTPGAKAPDMLFYQCGVHEQMGGKITLGN